MTRNTKKFFEALSLNIDFLKEDPKLGLITHYIVNSNDLWPNYVSPMILLREEWLSCKSTMGSTPDWKSTLSLSFKQWHSTVSFFPPSLRQLSPNRCETSITISFNSSLLHFKLNFMSILHLE